VKKIEGLNCSLVDDWAPSVGVVSQTGKGQSCRFGESLSGQRAVGQQKTLFGITGEIGLFEGRKDCIIVP